MPKQVQHSASETAKTDAITSPGSRVSLAIALAVSFLAVSFLLYPHVAQAYSCNVCHGVVIWNGNQGGAQTEAEVVSLTYTPADCTPNGNYVPHVGNVLWVINTNDSNCYPYDACWVETGYHTVTNAQGTSTSNVYYWVDVRPGTNNYHVHTFGNVQSGDLGYNAYLNIDEYGNTSTWEVNLVSETSGYSGTSTNNSMNPNQIQMGMELTGSKGESANTGYFTYNIWYGTSNNQWHYQENAGSTHNDSPIESGWYQIPASNGSNYGGSFYTSCPC